METISVPVLVLHAADDPMPPLAGAQQIAAQIPGARLVVFQRGGHLLLGHQEEARAEIAAFIRQHSDAALPPP